MCVWRVYCMIKSLKRAGICPRVSLTGIHFVSFCGGCEGILFDMEFCVRLCDSKGDEDEVSWVFGECDKVCGGYVR